MRKHFWISIRDVKAIPDANIDSAKKGTQIKTKPVNTLPFESAKHLIKTKLKSNTQSGYLKNQKTKAGKSN